MRIIEKLPNGSEELKRTDKRDQRLVRYLTEEINDAESASQEQRESWNECLRLYKGVPKQAYRKVPIEDAPNIEITLAAIAVDALYAQALTSVFAVSPLVTVRPTHAEHVDRAKELQRFTNWMAENELNLREACEHAFMDVIQLGTGALYTPFTHTVRKTSIEQIVDTGPRAQPVPIEDLIAPGGATQRLPWFSIRMWLTQSDLNDRKKRRRQPDEADDAYDADQKDKWDTRDFASCGNVGFVRSAREAMGQTTSNAKTKKLYEVHAVYVSFDYDRDGVDEDLLVIWDRTSRSIGWLNYCPYTMWPLDVARYQLQAHLFHGLGVVRMIAPYQIETTEGHNDRAANVKMVNMRMFKSKTGEVDEGTLEMWNGRNIQLSDVDALQEVKLTEAYPSAIQHEAATLALAEKRVGVSELNNMRPAASPGSRTPAFTTASLMQRENTRFKPAFDSMRGMAAGSVRQGLWRYHERLRTENDDGMAAQTIISVLGDMAGRLVIDLLRSDDFERSVAVELTGSSESVNRDADRQNAVMLTNLLTTYCEKILQLVSFVATPGVPPELIPVAAKVAHVISETIERTVRTFDQVRDPEAFVVEIDQELQAIGQRQQMVSAVQSLAQQFGLGGAQGGAPGAAGGSAQQNGGGGVPNGPQ